MRARDISARKQKSVYPFGHETSVGDGVAVFLLEVFLTARLIKSCARDVVDVKIEVCVKHHRVLVLNRRRDLLLGYGAYSLEVPCLANSHKRCGAYDIAVLVSRDVLTQKFDYVRYLLAAYGLRARQILGRSAVDIGYVGHIAGYDAGDGRSVEQNVTCGVGKYLFCERLKLSALGGNERLKRAWEYCALHINSANLEHQRCGLHLAVALASLDIFRTALVSYVAVSARVDYDLRAKSRKSLL